MASHRVTNIRLRAPMLRADLARAVQPSSRQRITTGMRSQVMLMVRGCTCRHNYKRSIMVTFLIPIGEASSTVEPTEPHAGHPHILRTPHRASSHQAKPSTRRSCQPKSRQHDPLHNSAPSSLFRQLPHSIFLQWCQRCMKPSVPPGSLPWRGAHGTSRYICSCTLFANSTVKVAENARHGKGNDPPLHTRFAFMPPPSAISISCHM